MRLFVTVLFSLFVLAPVAMAADEEQDTSSEKSVIPPPPPGPYMSTGLSSNNEFPGGRQNRLPKGDAANSPFFTPDMPWPVKNEVTNKWMPDGGYKFPPEVPDSVPAMKQRRYQGMWGNLPAPPAPMRRPPAQVQPAPMQRPVHRGPMNRAPMQRDAARPSAQGQHPPRPPAQRPPMQRPQLQRPDRLRPEVNRRQAQRPAPGLRGPRPAESGSFPRNRPGMQRSIPGPRPERGPARSLPPQRPAMPAPPGPWLPLDNYPR